jgi:hypothetical protein
VKRLLLPKQVISCAMQDTERLAALAAFGYFLGILKVVVAIFAAMLAL